MQASGPVKRGGKAFGTRDRVVECLLAQGDFRDSSGMASPKLAEAVGYPGSSIAFAQLLSGMERAGLITRDVRGKRTYRVHLTAAGRERARHLLSAASVPGRAQRRAASTLPGWQQRSGVPARSPASGQDSALPGREAGAGETEAGETEAGETEAGETGAPDYDALAHRLLVQVARRLLSEADERGEHAGEPAATAHHRAAPPPAPAVSEQRLDALEEKVAALERELSRAKAARSALQAENEDLRDQVARIRDNLDRGQPPLTRHQQPTTGGRLDQHEIALLQRLLAGRSVEDTGSRASTA